MGVCKQDPYTHGHLKFKAIRKKKFMTILTTYILLTTVNSVNIKKFTQLKNGTNHNEMRTNVHKLFLCVGFSGCYSSQQLSQNNIEFGPIKFKVFQNFQGPVRTLVLARVSIRDVRLKVCIIHGWYLSTSPM